MHDICFEIENKYIIYISIRNLISIIYFYFLMTDKLYIYCVLWVIAILCVLAFALKLEKMVQIIVWNYVLWSLFFSLWFCLDLAVKSSGNSGVQSFFSDAKIWILLVLYAAFFFFFVYSRSKIRVDFSSDPLIYKPLYLAFVPLTVVSMIVTIWLIILWWNAFSLWALNSISDFTQNVYLQKIIVNFPYIVCAYSFISLLVISDLKLKVKISVKNDW